MVMACIGEERGDAEGSVTKQEHRQKLYIRVGRKGHRTISENRVESSTLRALTSRTPTIFPRYPSEKVKKSLMIFFPVHMQAEDSAIRIVLTQVNHVK